MTEPSFLDLLDVCYRFDIDDAAWVAELADVGRPLLDTGLGTAAFLYRRHPDEASGRLQIQDLALSPRTDPTWLRQFLADIPSEFLDAWRTRPLGTIGRDRAFGASRKRLQDFGGASFVVSLNGLDPTGDGVWLGAPMSRREGPPPPTFARVAAHLASAARLRRRLRHQPEWMAEPEAILCADGKLEHATAAARTANARDALRRATVTLDRSRSSAGRSSPEQTVAKWRTLVAGRWSLVDRFDTDGKHYIVAAVNAVDARSVALLSERERQVLAFAALGHHNKLIAYEMGLSDSTVRVLFHRSATKLGARSREDTIAAYTNAEGAT